jgi:tRNA pseudouridine55 synthase
MQRGIFAVLKPVGVTSADVTKRIKDVLTNGAGRRHQGAAKTPKLKVGHGGTLDRGATGVLVIALGRDCKNLTTFLNSDKCYECVGRLGVATDTYDKSGEVVQTTPWKHIERSAVSETLAEHFSGEIVQQPPVYSALKYRGRRLSDLARKGIIFTPTPRRVTIHSIALMEFEPPFFKLAVQCSSGTYIRSIVHDLGQCLGSTAHVTELCRTKHGPFTLSDVLSENHWTLDNIHSAIKYSESTIINTHL